MNRTKTLLRPPAPGRIAAARQLLARASHDLRAPLNGIQTWAHVLEHHLRGAPPPVARALAGIRTGIQDQVRVIEGLLERQPSSDSPSPPGGAGREEGSKGP